jgi:hypothetical protein
MGVGAGYVHMGENLVMLVQMEMQAGSLYHLQAGGIGDECIGERRMWRCVREVCMHSGGPQAINICYF